MDTHAGQVVQVGSLELEAEKEGLPGSLTGRLLTWCALDRERWIALKRTGSRGRKAKLMLFFTATLLLLALLEAGATLRLGSGFVRGGRMGQNPRDLVRRDSVLGWSHLPGASAHIQDGTLDYRVHINTHGFRDPEREYAKPDRVRRILILGDSVAWGWGVSDGERFSDLLEERLGEHVQVINLAVPGYGTDQQYWSLVRSGFDYEPDIVLHCMVLNDVFEAEEIQHYGMPKPRFVLGADGEWAVERPPTLGMGGSFQGPGTKTLRWLQAHSALLTALAGGEQDAEQESDHDPREFQSPRQEDLDRVAEAASRVSTPGTAVHHALTLMAEACAERGVPFLVTCVPHKHDRYLYEPRFPRPADAVGDDYRGVLTREVVKAGEALGFEVIPVDGTMLRRTTAGDRLHCGDGHPNQLGHRVLADVLVSALRVKLDDLED